jgi:hypothetical protein
LKKCRESTGEVSEGKWVKPVATNRNKGRRKERGRLRSSKMERHKFAEVTSEFI